MADDVMRMAQQLMSMITYDAEGNFIGLSLSFNRETLEAILAATPKNVTYTFHERIAQYGEFGVYRVALNFDDGSDLESPTIYNVVLGDVTVPFTIPYEEIMTMRSAGTMIMVATVLQDAVTRANVITQVQKSIARRERYDGGASIDRSGLTEEEERRALRSIARSQRENREWVDRVAGALARLTGDDTGRDEYA